jgi:tRNA pseudouridine13 synthase
LKLKAKPEEFKVEEVLREKPRKRRGRYRYYKLKKRGLETAEAVERVARASGIPKGKILYGGIKDKNAETTQFIAVKEPLRLKELKTRDLEVEFAGWHEKSPRELLKGNRFEIFVREVKEVPEERLKALKEFGVPNYYGEQRFTPVRGGRFFVEEWLESPERAVKHLFTPAGWESSKARRAKKLFIEGKFSEAARAFKGWRRRVSDYLSKGGSWEGALKLIPKEEIEFQLNAFQSYLFNEHLSRLIKERVEKPLKFKYKLGYLYYPLERVNLPEELPIFTPQINLYDEILKERGVERERLKELQPLFHSFKRKTVVRPEELQVKGGWVSFFLPAGAYATNLLRFLFSAV